MKGILLGLAAGAWLVMIIPSAGAQDAVCVNVETSGPGECDPRDAYVGARVTLRSLYSRPSEDVATGGVYACVSPAGTANNCSEGLPRANASVEWELNQWGSPVEYAGHACTAAPLVGNVDFPVTFLPPGAWDPAAVRICIRDTEIHLNDCLLFSTRLGPESP